MEIILIILAILGLLKLVSLFICLNISIYYWIKDKEIPGIVRTSYFYKHFTELFLIPSIKVSYGTDYFEVIIDFLWFEYYSCYNLDKE